jgi:hypothetical protein
MNQKTPAAPGGAHRAGSSKGLGGTFDSQISNETSEQQDSTVPIAQARIVIGCKCSFAYIEHCPLCGLEHMHGQFPLHGPHSDALQAFHAWDGYRLSHCGAQGLYADVPPDRLLRGDYRLRQPPPEYHRPEGDSYRIVMAYPACFTPLGIKNEDARELMIHLAGRGAPTSLEILKPRRSFVLLRGDR